jgi:hypothetical protein
MAEELYTGLAVGGPMEGLEVESRYPGGVLFVSKPTNRAWLYDYIQKDGSAKFYLRPLGYDALWDEMSQEQKLEVIKETTLSGVDGTRELDREKRLAAAESTNTEVRALPDESRVVV